jgi:hypothetical protein
METHDGAYEIEKGKFFHDEMKIPSTCTLFEGRLQNFQEPATEGDIKIV